MHSSPFRLGIAPINWANDDMPELGGDTSLETCFTEMREAGYQGTEVGHKYPKEAARLHKLLAHHDLQLASCWHSTFYADQTRHSEQHEALSQRLQFLADLGVKRVNLAECTRSIHGQRHVLLRDKPILSPQEWDHLLVGLHAAADLCAQFGITMAYHHHMGTVVQTADEISRLLDGSDPNRVFLCLDTGHLTYAGIDPLWCLERYHKRISHVHLKDVRPALLTQYGHAVSFLDAVLAGIFTVPGDGLIDFKSFLQRLHSLGYEGWLIVEAEQDPAKAHPLTFAKMAYTHLSAIFANL